MQKFFRILFSRPFILAMTLLGLVVLYWRLFSFTDLPDLLFTDILSQEILYEGKPILWKNLYIDRMQNGDLLISMIQPDMDVVSIYLCLLNL